MKQLYLAIFIAIFVGHAEAKTTYIPTYDNRIMMIENGGIDSLTNQTHSLTMVSKDGIVSCTLAQQVVSEELVAGGKVQLVGFGTFEVAERAAREGRNPQSGEVMKIAASKAPKFKAGKALKDMVNK